MSVELHYIELTEAHCHLGSAEAGTREVTHIWENKSAPGLAATLWKESRKTANEVLARRDLLQRGRTTPVGVGDTIVGNNSIDNSRILKILKPAIGIYLWLPSSEIYNQIAKDEEYN